MPDPSGWVIYDQLSSPVNPTDIPLEASALAIEIIEAAERYDPPNCVGFFDSLIGDLELARQQIHGLVHADDGKLTG